MVNMLSWRKEDRGTETHWGQCKWYVLLLHHLCFTKEQVKTDRLRIASSLYHYEVICSHYDLFNKKVTPNGNLIQPQQTFCGQIKIVRLVFNNNHSLIRNAL
jgi:hypothetical protein